MSEFIDDLLKRMELADKIGQLNHPNVDGAETTGAGAAATEIERRIRRGEVGGLSAGLELGRLNELQRIAVEQSPQRIPCVVHPRRHSRPPHDLSAAAWACLHLGRPT